MGLARNSLRTFISQIIATLLQFIVGILTAQFLGPEGKGLLYILIVWLGICTQLGGLGLGEASIYLIGNDPKRLPAIFGNLLVASGALSLVVGSAGWLFLGYGRPSIYTQFPLWVWAVVAFLVPIHILQSFLMQVLSAVLRIKEINIVDVMRPMIQLLLFILLVIIIEYGVKGAFLAYALSVSFAATIFFILVLYHAKQLPRPDWKLLAVSLRYGIKTYLSSFLGLLALRLDALLVASLATNGIVAAGVYSVSTSLAELLLFIPTSIRLSLFPMVSAASTAEANRLTSAASRHTALLTTILALGLGVAGPLAIPRLYGEAFAGAMTPLLLLLPGVIMLCQALIFYGDLIGRGKPEATIISALLSLIATVVLDLLLIPKYGIVGAALASSCAYTVEFIIAGSFFVYHSGLPWRKLFLFQRSDLASYLGVLLAVRKIIGLAH